MTRAALVAAVLWMATPAPGAAQAAPDARALEALVAEFLAGASRGDAAVHDRFWADSLVYTRSTGRRVGKAEILAGLRAAGPAAAGAPATVYAAEDVRIQQFGNTAVVAFVLVGTTESGGRKQRATFLNTGTFLKSDGRWQAVAWQSTRAALDEAETRIQASAADAALHAALLAADVGVLEPLLDEGFVWTHSHGGRLTGRELIEQLRSGRLRYTRLETSHVTVSAHGTTAIVRGDSKRQRSAIPETPGAADPEPRTIFYTLTLVHDGLGWKAVAMHTSRP